MEGEGYKRRTLNHYSGLCLISTNGVPANLAYSIAGSQITYSLSHPQFFARKRGIEAAKSNYKVDPSPKMLQVLTILRDWDIGGSFYTTKHWSELQSPLVVTSVNVGSIQFPTIIDIRSYQFAHDASVTDTSTSWPSRATLANEMSACLAMGTKAIARTAPTVPVISLANMVGELKNDGIPALIGSIAYRAKSLPQLLKASGSEYLNVEFGWKPLLSDIQNACTAVVNSKRIIQQYEERSGRMIGRHYEFPVEKSTNVTEMGQIAMFPAFNTKVYEGLVFKGRKTLTVSSERRYWFEGRYQYSLPLASDARDKVMLYASEAQKLLGLEITPEVLWNLAPWSWLADWFLNIGAIMTNFSAFGSDNLLLNRGYIMCHSTDTNVYANSGCTIKNYGPTGTCSQTFRTETKVRRKATPWGFGVTFTALTPRQIAILAALGISRDWQVSRAF